MLLSWLLVTTRFDLNPLLTAGFSTIMERFGDDCLCWWSYWLRTGGSFFYWIISLSSNTSSRIKLSAYVYSSRYEFSSFRKSSTWAISESYIEACSTSSFKTVGAYYFSIKESSFRIGLTGFCLFFQVQRYLWESMFSEARTLPQNSHSAYLSLSDSNSF